MAENWTNAQLDNWISQRQCCLGNYLKKVVKLGEIGSKDFKCCMNKFILANIFIEMLTKLNSDQKNSNYSFYFKQTEDLTPTSISFAVYLDSVSVENLIVPSSTIVVGPGGMMTAQAFADALNNSDSDFTGTIIVHDLIGYTQLLIQAPDETYNGQSLIIVRDGVESTIKLSGGVAEDSACLTKEEQCELIQFINNLCETC